MFGMSRRKPMDSYLRFLCHSEQRERWRKAADRAGEDESAIARKLLDEWADRVLGPRKPPRK